ncbi:CinA family protein [Arcobacter porcinus]|uniref:Nicotinamide-nucleotide amidohydrolase PncC n=1 Tax=Arcobacter porcinus TaxID=1935204 RepID=A0ABX2YF19_9BACT|nr:CinA family protein [Arcobacter porcinus]OCL82976.1 Nicotinamide-nucleotide amidohydrolase PncC [Arcobacter porcinus]OCL84395.1 Nicotinamide-nucleotide amidohydrolase PncC [Arcobacter porcinus]OCL88936.1 Nicotinamide-nucleotide amidohydrolase PncC [Arcobacter porcinus]OCL93622.1 Nicotinamide-nucleotide amidohydrolase PncC [Arcobacter porcinus]
MQKKLFSKKDMLKLQNILKESKKTITCAESCTGGLVASLITKISGSSEIFNGSLVSYSNEIKHKELNVSYDTLNKFGAVSIETVSEMLDGVLDKFNADYAIAISGVAGPNGGTKDKPVGTVVIGISSKSSKKKIKIFRFKGDRETIQKKAAETSLKKISKFIKKTLDN